MNPNTLMKEVLTNAQIEQFLAIKETQKSLRGRLALLDKTADEMESKMISLIEGGADLSHCGYAISVQELSRRFPKWKEEFISRLGKQEADAVLNATSATIYKRLVVR